MPVPFPAIKPTSRRLVGPRWPVTAARSQSGVTSRRKWGSEPSNPELDLEFNCSSDQADDILAAHERSQGGVDYLVLPTLVWQGVSGRLLARMEAYGTDLRWTFGEDPPVIDWLVCDRARVTVRLFAELQA